MLKKLGFIHPTTKEYVEFDSELPKYFQDIFKRYIRFSRETEMKLQEMRDSVMPQDVKILGVLCRGTDYLLKNQKIIQYSQNLR